MSKATELYIKFMPQDPEILLKALHAMHGYATAKISMGDTIYECDREMMEQVHIITNTFSPALEHVKKIKNNEVYAKNLKSAFTNELLSILKDNKDPEQFPNELGALFNKYEIISRIEDDNLPF